MEERISEVESLIIMLISHVVISIRHENLQAQSKCCFWDFYAGQLSVFFYDYTLYNHRNIKVIIYYMKQTDRVGTCSSLSKIKGFFEKNSFSDLCSATGFYEFSSDHLSAPPSNLLIYWESRQMVFCRLVFLSFSLHQSVFC